RRAGRSCGVRQDGRRRHARRCGLRQDRSHAPIRSGSPDASRLCDWDLLSASTRDGRDERVPALGDQAPDTATVRQRESALYGMGYSGEQSVCGYGFAVTCRKSRNGLDDSVSATWPVQLVVAILHAGGGGNAELGWHRTMPEQPSLHARTLRRIADETRGGSGTHEEGRLVAGWP